MRREKREAAAREALERRNERIRHDREVAAAHAEAFSKPLIAPDVLTNEERAAEHLRVKNRPRWFPAGYGLDGRGRGRL